MKRIGVDKFESSSGVPSTGEEKAKRVMPEPAGVETYGSKVVVTNCNATCAHRAAGRGRLQA